MNFLLPFLSRLALPLTLTLALAIAFLTLTPLEVPPAIDSLSDKAYHAIAFAALAAPMSFAQPRYVYWIVIAVLTYGGAIEVIQPHVGRAADWGDFLADGLGVAIGSSLGWSLRLYLAR